MAPSLKNAFTNEGLIQPSQMVFFHSPKIIFFTIPLVVLGLSNSCSNHDFFTHEPLQNYCVVLLIVCFGADLKFASCSSSENKHKLTWDSFLQAKSLIRFLLK